VKKIKVDWDFLCHAFEDASGEADYYLDTETGEVIMISELAATIEECEKIRDEIEKDSGDRYLYIERQMPAKPLTVWVGYAPSDIFTSLEREDAEEAIKEARAFVEAMKEFLTKNYQIEF